MHNMEANKTYGEKAWRQLQKNAASNSEQVLQPTTYHENYPVEVPVV